MEEQEEIGGVLILGGVRRIWQRCKADRGLVRGMETKCHNAANYQSSLA